MLKKISERVGFTPTEIKVILFLLFVFIVGYSVKTFYLLRDKTSYKEFDYLAEDSTFYEMSGNKDTVLSKSTGLRDKKVDYKQEVLDFNKSEFGRSEKKLAPAENSININTAEIKELTKLPGIGKKTAEKIIDFRKKTGGFTKLNELLQVQGIGNSKFNNIKKYITIK